MLITNDVPPLEIAEIEVGLGRIGIAPCPGRGMRNSLRMKAGRDLGDDLRRIRDWGASTVVSVIETAELGWLQVPHLPGEVLRHRMDWLLVPVRDRDVLDDKAERVWANHGARIRGYIQQGQRILFHCRAGHGRSGMMAARTLIELGWDVEMAIAEVRRVRPGAIERASQEAAVRGWARHR